MSLRRGERLEELQQASVKEEAKKSSREERLERRIKERRGRMEGEQRNQWCFVEVITEKDVRERKKKEQSE